MNIAENRGRIQGIEPEGSLVRLNVKNVKKELFSRYVEYGEGYRQRVNEAKSMKVWVTLKSTFIALLGRLMELFSSSWMQLELPLDERSTEYGIKSFLNNFMSKKSNVVDTMESLRKLGGALVLEDNSHLVKDIFESMNSVQLRRIYENIQDIYGLRVGLKSYGERSEALGVMSDQIDALEAYAKAEVEKRSLKLYEGLDVLEISEDMLQDGVQELMEALLAIIKYDGASPDDNIVAFPDNKQKKEVEQSKKAAERVAVSAPVLKEVSDQQLKHFSKLIMYTAVKNSLKLGDVLANYSKKIKSISLKMRDLFTENVVDKTVHHLLKWGIRKSSKKFKGDKYLMDLYQLHRVHKTDADVMRKMLERLMSVDLKDLERMYHEKLRSEECVNLKSTLHVLSLGDGPEVQIWKNMYKYACALEDGCFQLLKRYKVEYRNEAQSDKVVLMQKQILPETKEAIRKMWAWSKEYDRAFGVVIHGIDSKRMRGSR